MSLFYSFYIFFKVRNYLIKLIDGCPLICHSKGIPLGISSAVPILLQNRGVTYAEQAIFTFAFYPFTCESHLMSLHLK